MVTRPPPLRAPPRLQRDVGIDQFEAKFSEIEIVAVVGGADAQEMTVADEFRLRHQRSPVTQLNPSAHIGLVLHTIDIIFAAAILTKPNSLPAADGRRIELARDTGPRA